MKRNRWMGPREKIPPPKRVLRESSAFDRVSAGPSDVADAVRRPGCGTRSCGLGSALGGSSLPSPSSVPPCRPITKLLIELFDGGCELGDRVVQLS